MRVNQFQKEKKDEHSSCSPARPPVNTIELGSHLRPHVGRVQARVGPLLVARVVPRGSGRAPRAGGATGWTGYPLRP